ncbi:S-layer homology domain-containing protein, partial [Egicoccus sp. AB-alg6-2]|uniref:S-layer homology domain-containing protein n=1 Tax=Egicoccus sp. AB-alg6-2 TaxID=3242692 RepID=UPI00359CC4EB
MSVPQRPTPVGAQPTALRLTLVLALLTALLSALLSAPTLGGNRAEATNTPVFHDSVDTVHADAIHDLAADGIVRGCTPQRFCPDAAVTRAQLAALLTRLLELPPRSDVVFSDVGANHTHAGAIGAAAHAGIAVGAKDGRYRPGADVTREQAAAMISRALGLTASATSTSHFVDVTGTTHAGAIAAVAAAEISVGCRPERFCPDATLTRGQAASLVQRAKKVEKQPRTGPAPAPAP